ncbi:uncharacterized protein LY89DRAFT_659514 [Mollisia scopiformis]|uniref:Centromere protein H C-terminal domain-containing protein n=1 Tax=Mollisia scopiformis TaxID=149040 RepID=A0A132B7R1_MOLSC|nr:uncharacterized protein LY89DRAFT_659514 [Mollisia scopiformis]KUJ07924.1 hypothetical protein LY89DRAFT_659514 [Mollisia scopiformis]
MDRHENAMEGVELTTVQPSKVAILSDEEKRVLEIYDRLEELQLEVALLKAQGVLLQDIPRVVSEEQIIVAQKELLEAKAGYQLRSSIIESVFIANPIITAVHAGSNASVLEQDLLPFIEQRDELSIVLTQVSKQVSTARDDLIQVQTEHITTANRNVELAASMIALAKEANAQTKDDISDPKVRQQLDRLEELLKVSKRKWRIMKGTASATIVGSGVDWARDPKLLEVVLDDEGD